MKLMQKGERNLELAAILNSGEFLELSGLQKGDLCSVIINRLYYGVYLIAKGKLVEKGVCNSNERLHHSGKNCIWEKLENENCFNEIKLAHQLRYMRNRADYQEDHVDNAGRIETAQEIAQELFKTLKEIE